MLGGNGSVAYRLICHTSEHRDTLRITGRFAQVDRSEEDGMKITLVGDSVFDNKVYVGSEKSTLERAQDAFRGHEVELLAVDGSVTRDVIDQQLPRVTHDTRVVFVSTGGNDALRYESILNDGLDADSIQNLFQGQAEFKRNFEELISKLGELKRATAAFTIYEGSFDDPGIQNAATVAISIFNDVIYRVCREYGVKVIENRDICNRPEHFANPIEPSSLGSKLMVEAMVNAVKKK
jgi:hypothetical protein